MPHSLSMPRALFRLMSSPFAGWAVALFVAVSLVGQGPLLLSHGAAEHASSTHEISPFVRPPTAPLPLVIAVGADSLRDTLPDTTGSFAYAHDHDGDDSHPCEICRRLELAKNLISPALPPLSLLGRVQFARLKFPEGRRGRVIVIVAANPRGPPAL